MNMSAATAPSAGDQKAAPVLCVDLDGTLVKTDLLWECFVALLKKRTTLALASPFLLVRGRAYLKRRLAEAAMLDCANLPYRADVVEFIREQRAQGRKVVLVTAAHRSVAEKVAEHLGCFDEVYASDGEANLKGDTKAAFLSEKFGAHGFEYVGDSAADLPVWKQAAAGYVVGNGGISRRAASVTLVKRVFETKRASLVTWVRAMRGHHWAKNLLLFLPLLLAHRFEMGALLRTLLGFVLLGICASSLYILNDLLDLHSDRAHPWKSARPFAAGETSIPAGLAVSLLLVTSALVAGFLFDVKFGFVLACYAVLTMWYSLQLKRVVLLDVFTLAGFYVMRVWAGSLSAGVPLSEWFLAFALFFFLSLAMAKRYSELLHANHLVQSGNSGRGYRECDRELLSNLGIGSSFAAAVILALYVQSREVLALYRRPEPLLLLCVVILYWLSKMWLKAHRGELHEDPVTLALSDRESYAVACVTLIIVALSMVRAG
jgi:4-hydroxybenzoate polyprenyltransferase/phosphoserine phosphatase